MSVLGQAPVARLAKAPQPLDHAVDVLHPRPYARFVALMVWVALSTMSLRWVRWFVKGGLKSQVQHQLGLGIVLEAAFKEDFRGHPEVQSCMRPCVRAPRDLVKLALTVDTQVCAFWQVLPDQSIDVLVSPRCQGVAQQRQNKFSAPCFGGKPLVQRHLPWV